MGGRLAVGAFGDVRASNAALLSALRCAAAAPLSKVLPVDFAGLAPVIEGIDLLVLGVDVLLGAVKVGLGENALLPDELPLE